MEKKKYETPEIVANGFAQFENVYTACNKNPAGVCVYDDGITEPGNGNSHHGNLMGGNSIS